MLSEFCILFRMFPLTYFYIRLHKYLCQCVLYIFPVRFRKYIFSN